MAGNVFEAVLFMLADDVAREVLKEVPKVARIGNVHCVNRRASSWLCDAGNLFDEQAIVLPKLLVIAGVGNVSEIV
jgi:hypothetical protein